MRNLRIVIVAKDNPFVNEKFNKFHELVQSCVINGDDEKFVERLNTHLISEFEKTGTEASNLPDGYSRERIQQCILSDKFWIALFTHLNYVLKLHTYGMEHYDRIPEKYTKPNKDLAVYLQTSFNNFIFDFDNPVGESLRKQLCIDSDNLLSQIEYSSGTVASSELIDDVNFWIAGDLIYMLYENKYFTHEHCKAS